MRYELFLRRVTLSRGRPADAAAEAEADADAEGQADGGDALYAAVAARAAEAELSCERFVREGQTLGADLAVDADAPRAAERLVESAFALAEQHALVVFDPQLGRPVSRGDAEAIEQRLAQTGAFGAAGLGSLQATPQVGSRSAAKLWLIVAASLGALFLLTRLLRCAVQ